MYFHSFSIGASNTPSSRMRTISFPHGTRGTTGRRHKPMPQPDPVSSGNGGPSQLENSTDRAAARLPEAHRVVHANRGVVPEGHVQGQALVPEVREGILRGGKDRAREAAPTPIPPHADLREERRAHPLRREGGARDARLLAREPPGRP